MNFKKKLKAYYFRSPKIFSDFFLLNLIGYPLVIGLFWQVFYSLARQWHKWTVRHSQSLNVICDGLAKDGYYILPNFFSAEDHQKILTFFAQRENDFTVQQDVKIPTHFFSLRSFDFSDNESSEKEILCLFENRHLEDIALSQTGIPSQLKPLVYCFKQGLNITGPKVRNKNDASDIFHYDVPYPTIKAIYYVDNTTKENGAFIIGKGSHQFSLRRLWGEYLYALRTTAPKSFRRLDFDGLERFFNLSEVRHLEAPANSLALVNVQGVHRRGDFYSQVPRRTIFVDFRATASLANASALIVNAFNFHQSKTNRQDLLGGK